MDGSCDFILNPELWEGEIKRIKSAQTCPYPKLPGLKYCAFHSPSIVLKTASNRAELHEFYKQAFLTKGVLNLLGGTVWYLDFQDVAELIDFSEPINIGYSTFICELNLSEHTFQQPVFMVGANIESLLAHEAIFKDHVNLWDSEIGLLDFRKSEIRGEASFENSSFERAKFDGSVFMRTASFCQAENEDASIQEAAEHAGTYPAKFIKPATFVGATFNELAIFAGVNFQSAGVFFHTKFNRGANFKGVDAGAGLHFGSARFEGIAGFSEASLGTTAFVSSHFNDIVVFEKSSFGGPFHPFLVDGISNHVTAEGLSGVLEYTKACERAMDNSYYSYIARELFQPSLSPHDADLSVSFQGARPDDYFYFENITTTSPIDLRHLTFDYLVLGARIPRKRNDAIGLEGSKINSGELVIIDPEHSNYQLSRSTIGSVDVISPTDHNIFENVYIADTRFDGFDFSDYRRSLIDNNWEIDSVFFKPGHDEPLKRETTYSKAKAGASDQGDTYAESKFFIKERRFRRQRYKSDFKDSSKYVKKGKIGLNIFTNYLYDITCEYGENPRRVSILSIITILGYALLYWIVDELYANPNFANFQFSLSHSMEYVTFSLQAFTSFFIPGGLNPNNPLINFFSSTESFFGAFAIALFVATIVRTVER